MAQLAWIQFVDHAGQGPSIDNSLPGSPVYPSQGLPPAFGGGHPGNALPGGGHISLLPVYPFDPTLKPGNELPGDQPEGGQDLPIRPGRKFVVKWLCGAGMILVPDNSLPQTPEPK